MHRPGYLGFGVLVRAMNSISPSFLEVLPCLSMENCFLPRLGASGMVDVLAESWRIQAEASARGFDWPDVHGVLDKIEEELNEVREAIHAGDLSHAQRELGDLFLASVNAARFLKIDPAQTLAWANTRFAARFKAVENELVRQGRSMENCSLDELDAVWNQVKSGADQSVEKGA
jgi:nucleoside triphosphate diphosphatase